MKKLSVILLIAAILAGGAVASMSTPSQAQYIEYTTPPPDPYAVPWVGPGTPWVYYNGDWFLNGLLYLFFGPDYGWAPYYAYPYTYVVRPVRYYAPFYATYYRTHPVIIERFVQTYPYWRSHRQGHHYDERFFEQHHRSQGGWHQGFHGKPPTPGGAAPAVRPAPSAPAPSRVAPTERPAPGPTRVAPPAAPKPGPPPAAPPERREPGPSRMAPPAGQPAPPAHVAPPAAPRPGPAVGAPPAAPRPAPAPAPAPKAAPAPKPAPAKPEGAAPAPGGGAPGGGHGEEKH